MVSDMYRGYPDPKATPPTYPISTPTGKLNFKFITNTDSVSRLTARTYGNRDN